MNDMGNLTTPPEVKKQKAKKRTAIWKWVSIVLGTIIVAAAVGLATGLASLSIKGFGSVGSGQKQVCSNEVVSRYNTAAEYKDTTTENGVITFDESAVRQIIGEVKELSYFENDATCQAIIFLAAINLKDFEAAKSAAESVKELHGKGMYANSNIRENPSLHLYDSWLASINPLSDTQEPADDIGQ